MYPAAPPPLDRRITDRRGHTITAVGRPVGYWDHVRPNALVNIVGSLASALPMGPPAAGLPVGAQVKGPAAADPTAVAFARNASRLLGGHHVPPRFA